MHEKVQLNRFDLFHAHLFIDYSYSDVGIIFHAREYPAFNKGTFPYILGYCQKGSTLVYDDDQMALRNFVWYKVRLVSTQIKTEKWRHYRITDTRYRGFFSFYRALLTTEMICVQDNLAALNTSSGNILSEELLFPGTQLCHTVFEDELGVPAADIFFFQSLCTTEYGDALFVCDRFHQGTAHLLECL